MNFTSRSQNLAGTHAFLSPSKHSWLNYDDEKLDAVYYASQEARRGSELHALAHDLIRLRQRLPDINKTLNMYVNDAIGFGMTSEQLLYYSPNCYGHADCISFRGKVLRIHDLKNGVNPGHMEQLLIYAALFFLEYKKVVGTPKDAEVELRMYQLDEVQIYVPTADEIFHVMDIIVTLDKRLSFLRLEDPS